MDIYIKEILKPFNFSNMSVEITTVYATILTTLAVFSEHYLGVSGAFALVLLVLIIVDFFTGVISAIHKGEIINSKKGLRSLYKAGAYVLFLYVSYNLYRELEGKAELFETVIKYFHIYILVHVSFWELFSIDENLKKLKIDLGITDVLKNTYKNITKIFNNIANHNKSVDIIDEDIIDEDIK